MDTLTLKDALLLLVSGGGGAISYWLMAKVPALVAIKRPDYKRYVSLAIQAALPILSWLVMMGMGYESPPVAWQGWIERCFALAAGAIIVGQGMHGAIDLRKRATS
jgi:hypothetical protein